MLLRARPPVIVWRLFVVATIVAFMAFVLCYPLNAGDTDTWYHLAAGRRIASEGIPHDSSFSFLEPLRSYVDYYWLFQLGIFEVHATFGPWGLMVLRAALFAGLLVVAAGLVNQRAEAGQLASACLLFSAIALLLAYRELLLRPHMVTYLCLATFLYVLERRRVWMPALPLVALLWVNVHGITYPFLWVVAFAYLLDLALERKRGSRRPEARREALSLAASMLVVPCTPHGLGLLRVPFGYSQFVGQYIKELKPPEPASFLNFEVEGLVPSNAGIVLVLGGLALAHAARSAREGRLRPSQVIVLGLAFVFLFKARRFAFEFGLFCLPFAAAHRSGSSALSLPKGSAVAAGVLGVIALFVLGDRAKSPAKPISATTLPVGTAHFLTTVGAGGTVLNHPDDGGYLYWELFPRYRIYMDMEIPFLFRDEDFFLFAGAQNNAHALGSLLRRYHPTYVSVRRNDVTMGESLARTGDYKPVFFDDICVLYASRAAASAVVDAYEFKVVDPFHDFGRPFADVAADRPRDRLVAELERNLRAWPGGQQVNLWMAQAGLERRDLEPALLRAKRLTDDYPEESASAAVRGQVHAARGEHAEGVRWFAAALERATSTHARSVIEREMGHSLAKMRRYEEAFTHVERGTPLFDGTSTAQEIYELAGLAVLAGKPDEARVLAQFAEARLGPDDHALRARIEEGMREAGIAPLPGR